MELLIIVVAPHLKSGYHLLLVDYKNNEEGAISTVEKRHLSVELLPV